VIRPIHRRQRGAALVISLVMLVLITLLVIAALSLGTANFRAVSNTQFREEAISAANFAIQNRISSNFDTNAADDTTEIDVDLNNDGTDEYTVAVTPICVSATVASSADPSSVSLPSTMTAGSSWNTVWDIAADVDDPVTGAAVEVHAGVRVLLTDAAKTAACP
jgi:Tfp pilus assembly protein PilX